MKFGGVRREVERLQKLVKSAVVMTGERERERERWGAEGGREYEGW